MLMRFCGRGIGHTSTQSATDRFLQDPIKTAINSIGTMGHKVAVTRVRIILKTPMMLMVKVSEVATTSQGMVTVMVMTEVAMRGQGLEILMTTREVGTRKKTTDIAIWLMIRMTRAATNL